MIAAGQEPLLCLRGVDKIYGDDANPLQVLFDISLSVAAGEFVTIVGPSGAGKSTILNILGCLDRPTRGAYLLTGQDVARFDDQQLSIVRRERIGFVFQGFQLISHLSVLENVEMPLLYARQSRQARRDRCRELIGRVGLAQREGHRPSQLSGGEKQRAAIARALANNPALLLADEPTGNLDSHTSGEIMRLIHELHDAGHTILLITHDPELADGSPRRITLRDGRVESDVRKDAVTNVPA